MRNSLARARILVVDDYEPFRCFLRTTLEGRPELQVIGEACDGFEAVQKSVELQPNLILLDIGLPTLNGIEAARQIRKLSPESKILFISQESSADLVQEALALGALGYLVKAHAGSELLAAVEAVLEGRQFLSGVLSGYNSADATDPQALRSVVPAGSSMGGIVKREIARSHGVEFYSDDVAFVDGFTRFIEIALEAGNAVIVVATESHQTSLLLRLQEHGVDIAAAIAAGRYVPLDVAETLATFMGSDLPDRVRFLKIASDLVMEAAKAAKGDPPRVAACGECAPTLWAQGQGDAAVQLEHLWDEIAGTYEVAILCGYVLNSFQREQESHIYERICAEHSAVSSR
jgi:DNA-binding NarL/FixJ family response regulator